MIIDKILMPNYKYTNTYRINKIVKATEEYSDVVVFTNNIYNDLQSYISIVNESGSSNSNNNDKEINNNSPIDLSTLNSNTTKSLLYKYNTEDFVINLDNTDNNTSNNLNKSSTCFNHINSTNSNIEEFNKSLYNNIHNYYNISNNDELIEELEEYNSSSSSSTSSSISNCGVGDFFRNKMI